MALLKGSKILAECMVKAGVQRIYGIIGTSNIYFVDALYDYQDKLKYISCRHEQVAATMADAEGRLTQKPGVVLLHSGPGAFNSLISLGNAYKDSSPLIAVTGAVKRRLQGRDGMLEAEHLKIFAPICKGVFRAEAADEIIEIFSKAYRAAISEAKGPVLIEIPEDVWLESIEINDDDFSKLNLTAEKTTTINEDDVIEVLNAIQNAQKPLILAGGGVAYSHCEKDLLEFVEKSNIPVVTTGNGRGVISEKHKLNLGRAGFGGGNMVADTAFTKADLIVGIGCVISDMTTYEFTNLPQGEVMLINYDKDVDSKGVYVSKQIYGDCQEFLQVVLKNKDKFSVKENWIDKDSEIVLAKQSWDGILQSSITSNKEPLSPGRVCNELNKLIPDDTIITVGAGMHLLYPMAFIPSQYPLKFLSAVNFGAMGFGLAAAFAAKLVNPQKEVIAILGDGDFSMTFPDLETAKREGINIKVFILNDNSYRVLLFRQKLQLQGRVIGSLHTNPDFLKLAESYGIKGVRIDKVEDIVSKLKNIMEEDVLTLVEVVCDIDDLAPTNINAVMKMSM